MTVVVALIHGKPGTYGVSFPDFPGAVSGGQSLDEALERGSETLAAHVEALLAEGLALPAIRSLDDLRGEPGEAEAFSEAVAVAAVKADLPGRVVRLNISMDETLVQRIDRKAKMAGETRSRFLAKAARRRLAEDV